MTSGLKTKLDYDDLASVPPDGKRYELLDGDLHVTAAPSYSHQRAVGRLFRNLQRYFPPPVEVILAPFDVILSRRDVVEPDLIVAADPATVRERGVEGAPFLVVEVLSPSTADFDRNVKARFYATHGIAHYWIVDPVERRVECFTLDGDTYRLAAACQYPQRLSHRDFPGLRLSGLWC
jgi:Uma2 family endonuclease